MASNSVLSNYSNEEVVPYLSPYLHKGRKKEDWKFDYIKIQDTSLLASCEVINPFVSSFDSGGFHLSIFTAQEVCSELLIFWSSKRSGQSEKAGEAWVKEMSSSMISPIRESRNIKVSLDIQNFRFGAKILFADSRFRLEDSVGGLFHVNIKGIIALG